MRWEAHQLCFCGLHRYLVQQMRCPALQGLLTGSKGEQRVIMKRVKDRVSVRRDRPLL